MKVFLNILCGVLLALFPAFVIYIGGAFLKADFMWMTEQARAWILFIEFWWCLFCVPMIVGL